MKILAIRLKNLASLAGEQVIDFTAEPLANAGLFAITGPTGAGKSTILDALCLALFGSTPRLDSVSPLNKVPDVDAEIGGGDERNLLRRGCGSGHAEVDFIGVDGHRYRARWEVKRAREKVDGRLQASSQSLTDLDSGQLLASGKKREFRELLEARLGLNLAQFTRAVLLAQSEFAAFLKADDNERGTLLEKLTDTGLYSRLGQAAFEAAKRAREALAQLQQQAGGVQPLEPEARQALQDQHSQQTMELKSLQQQLKALEQQRQWLTELRRLEKEHSVARAQLQEAEDEQERLADARRILALFEQLAPQRHRFIRASELPSLLAKTDETLARHDREHAEVQRRLAELEQTCRAATETLEAAEQGLKSAEPALAQARREEERLSHFGNDLREAREQAEQTEAATQAGELKLTQLHQQQKHAAQQLDALGEQLARSVELQPLCAAWNGYRPRLQQAVQIAARLRQGRAELPALEAAARTAEAAQATTRQALDALQAQIGGETSEQLAQLTTQLEGWRAAEREFETLQRLWSRQQQLVAQQRSLQSEQSRQQGELETLTQAGKVARVERDDAQKALQLVQALLERQRLARSANVEALRAALVPGEPCNVCGSLEHPWHDGQALLAALDQQDEREAEQAQRQLQAQDERLQTLRDQHVALTGEIKRNAQRLTEITEELAQLQPQLAALSAHADLLTQAETDRQPWLDTRLATLKTDTAAAIARQRELLALQQRSEALRQDWQRTQEICAQANQTRDQQCDAIARDDARLNEELAEFANLFPAAQLERWREAPADTFMQLDGQVEARRQQLEQQTELTEVRQQCQTALEHEQLQQHHRRERHQACAERLADLQTREQACSRSLRQSLGLQPSAQVWQQQLEQAIQNARQQQAEVDRQLNEARLELTRLAGEQQNCRQRRDELLAERHELDEELATWRSAHPELDDATLAQLLHMDDALLEEARQRLRDNSEQLARCRERLEGCGQRIAAHQQQHAEMLDVDTLEQHFAEQQASCDQAERHCAETRAALLDDDRRRNQSLALLGQIEAAKAEHQRWGRIAALIGSSDGGAFRKIAQGYNLDLLVQHANVQLRQLARRYRLKRGGSPLGLLVMDIEMGDELRSVHSLSGGETFLVSLALALGLASMASSKLRIESLFIDEGFGSLDPESLQIAMDALDSLQAQGRKVAVISHVAEMHERIPVQIQVQRQGNGQSGLRIVGGAG
ncbi:MULTISPECIES: AAA family ATPase [Pseudomonadaceae]|uniref:AAA family ATPase n=1 Tax=Pseudomonadaceae TaxID=135621 RepID=UPI0015E45FDE|nr:MULTISPECIES: AAA family ATPase [Pseudomonadaceae]MBA1280189.1 AAA family ATPase [Stutzerimonas stutzeri]MBC8651361.1 AAA family ATPase [Pseudomonas sp. MT4]QXY91886.1 AAA family ATPase [Pseudomonas sp. MTM4]